MSSSFSVYLSLYLLQRCSFIPCMPTPPRLSTPPPPLYSALASSPSILLYFSAYTTNTHTHTTQTHPAVPSLTNETTVALPHYRLPCHTYAPPGVATTFLHRHNLQSPSFSLSATTTIPTILSPRKNLLIFSFHYLLFARECIEGGKHTRFSLCLS